MEYISKGILGMGSPPTCGLPKRRKKIKVICLVWCIILSLFSCQNNSSSFSNDSLDLDFWNQETQNILEEKCNLGVLIEEQNNGPELKIGNDIFKNSSEHIAHILNSRVNIIPVISKLLKTEKTVNLIEHYSDETEFLIKVSSGDFKVKFDQEGGHELESVQISEDWFNDYEGCTNRIKQILTAMSISTTIRQSNDVINYQVKSLIVR